MSSTNHSSGTHARFRSSKVADGPGSVRRVRSTTCHRPVTGRSERESEGGRFDSSSISSRDWFGSRRALRRRHLLAGIEVLNGRWRSTRLWWLGMRTGRFEEMTSFLERALGLRKEIAEPGRAMYQLP